MRRALALVALLWGCGGPTYAPGYAEAFARGLRAQSAGRWAEAEGAFDDAARIGDRYKDRAEALVLRAEAEERQGRLDEAEATYRLVVAESDGRNHGVRARFALGRLVWAARGFEAGSAELVGAMRAHPDSGLLRPALRRLLGHVEDERGVEGALAWLVPLASSLGGTPAEQTAEYERGTLLWRAGRREEARDVFVATARRFPYPSGALTDDALYQAARIEEELGRPAAAAALLEEVLAPREEAHLGSSYERPRFPDAQLRLGLLYAGPLEDGARGARELRRVHDEHPTARVVDDALWYEARLEARAGDAARACSTLELLERARPDSRFVRCAHRLCARLAPRERPCADYVERTLTGPVGPALLDPAAEEAADDAEAAAE